MPYKDITPPAGEKITRGQTVNVPDQPVIPFIRGDGTGRDIWAASVRVFDAAVEKAYGGKKKVDMIIFRENTEDIYAGIEYAAGTPESNKILEFLAKEFPKEFDKVRFGTQEKAKKFWSAVGAKDFPTEVRVGIGIKPVSYSGSVRLIHSAISYAIRNNRKSVTLVHKGNIM